MSNLIRNTRWRGRKTAFGRCHVRLSEPTLPKIDLRPTASKTFEPIHYKIEVVKSGERQTVEDKELGGDHERGRKLWISDIARGGSNLVLQVPPFGGNFERIAENC
jgi:hypothetical protein